jgi:hypothetical protein
MPRAAKKPTPEQLAKIEKLAGLGCTLNQIAIAIDISPRTLDRWKATPEVERAYGLGRLAASQAVAQKLYDLCMEGNTTAIIFWLKSQAGWTDKPVEEPINPAQVVIYLPDNGRGVRGSSQ